MISIEVGGQRGTSGAGSGFVVTLDGYAMTNSHVAKKIRVRTPAGERVDAQVVGDDPATDLTIEIPPALAA